MNKILPLIAVASVMQFIFTITSETLIIQFGVMDDWRLVSIP